MATSHEQFIDHLLREFPRLGSELTDETWAGLLHLETACFARYTQEAIDRRDKKELERCFNLAARVFMDADPDVKKAIYVSYLEHLNFIDGHEKRAWALEMMPPALRKGSTEITEYMAMLSSVKRGTDKP